MPSGDALFDAELSGGVDRILLSDDRVVAAGKGGWALWDRDTTRLIKGGSAQLGVDLVGDTLLTNDATAFTLWNARDGAQKLVVPTPDGYDGAQLSHDGSYVLMIGGAAVSAWDLSGKKLLTHALELSSDGVFAAPGEIRIIRRDVQRVETISLDTGTARTSGLFDGAFSAWFVDGNHFITVPGVGDWDAPKVRVYTKDATLVQSIDWPTADQGMQAGGENGHFWVWDQQITVHRLGQADPLLTVDDRTAYRPRRSTMTILPNEDGDNVQLLDLRGDLPKLSVNLSPGPAHLITTDEAGHWFYDDRGVVVDGSRSASQAERRELGCGTIVAIAGGGDRVALATAHGITRLYSFREGQPKLVWKHSGLQPTGFAFMGNGRYLAVTGLEDGATLSELFTMHIYEFDEEDRLVRQIRHPVNMSLTGGNLTVAASSTRYVQTLCDWSGKFNGWCKRNAMDIDGPLPWRFDDHVSGNAFPIMSPSGALVAVETYHEGAGQTFAMYKDGTFVRELSGSRPLLWLSDDRLIVEVEKRQKIVDLTGAVIMELSPLQGAPHKDQNGVFYDQASVYRDRDGKRLWSASRPTHPWQPRATVGSHFVYIDNVDGRVVRFESFAASLAQLSSFE